ncbi:zinc ABC transporter substrate-binding protein [Vibrio kyushuensis]|uniref:zinc ABC transporter substrate-binding protein n=1 Tax=Vibrio kyushuensis TaxID=2910249 RepID=UPI003D0B8C94
MKFIHIVAIAASSLPAYALQLDILTSIKPIEMIAHELVLEEDTVSSLLNAAASPHDYALKPSDVVRMKKSDLVIWFGSELESFLAKPLASQSNTLTLSEHESLSLRNFGKKCGCGKSHGSHDPHIWLGPQQAREVAEIITDQLILMDEENTVQYKYNLYRFNMNLTKTELKIGKQLKQIKHKGYFVFHDAYGYFEEYFGTNNLGRFTVDPERKTGAKKLMAIRTTLIEQNVQCVFTEPQFQPGVIESTVRGTSTKIGNLDPLGVDIEVHDGSYFEFLESISISLTNCLSS